MAPPLPPPYEPGSSPRIVVPGGFIGQSEGGGFCGPGKYIVVGQAPPVGSFGGRYGVTIRNGNHFSSLRVVGSTGDSILSWGNNLLRFRYEGAWWSKPYQQWAAYKSRDIMVIDRCGHVVVFGGITSNSYYYRSDLRLKDDIEPIDGALQKVMAMQGVSFRFKEQLDGDEERREVEADEALPGGPIEGKRPKAVRRPEPDEDPEDEPEENHRRLGLIAQEVAKVCPEVVAADENGYLSMDATQINAVLVEAIKDQQKIIDTQQARLETQQTRLDRMEKALAKLGIEL